MAKKVNQVGCARWPVEPVEPVEPVKKEDGLFFLI
jgi:hypothetical protein